MSERRRFVLAHTTARNGAADAVRSAPDGYVVEVRPPKRTLDQNAKFHAICEDMGRQGAMWAGKPRTAKEWKVLLVSGHAVATGEEAEVVTGLEGELVSIRESTADMGVRRGSSLIEYALAYCASNRISLSDETRMVA